MKTIADLEFAPDANPPSLPARESPAMFAKAEATDMVGAIWRYRWAVAIPAVVGGLLGFLIYLRTPETYRSTTRLMVESDRPAILDSLSGKQLGGVPSIEIVQSQLYSDKVAVTAFNDIEMQPYRELYNDDVQEFIEEVQDKMELEPEVDDAGSNQALVMLLHFDSFDREHCRAAVKAFSAALQSFYNEKHQGSREDLIRLIRIAMDQLHPKMTQLEQRYADFRRDAPLAWDAEGRAINPHRERQLFLVENRSEIVEQLRHKQILLAALESIAQQSKDPLVSLNVMGQMLGTSITVPQSNTRSALTMRDADAELAEIELNQKLFPLMIERNKFAEEFGGNHPTVKQLDSELNMMRGEFKRLVEEHSKRLTEIAERNNQNAVDPVERATEAVKSVIFATKAEVRLLETQIKEKDAQIAAEKADAIKIAKYEQDNSAMLREIERNRQLMDQLEEQMARVSLSEEESETRVIELTAPTLAYLVDPLILKNLGIGIFVGLFLGSGLALLLEKNANTFRDADEIAELLGAPVLTHVPFFKGRLRKPKKGELNPYQDLDPQIAILHQPASVASESIRSLRTSIFFETAGPGGTVLQITSPLPGDGKSTIASNLACAIAQSGKSVLAVDCDLRRPQLTDNFAMSDRLGLTNVLNGECDVEDASHQSPVPCLSVMPSGPVPANPAEALTLPEMRELLDLLREQYDYIVLDTPPLLVVTDPSITASMADGVILTLRVRRKSKPNAKESINILRGVSAHVMGAVINNSDEAGPSDGYRGYGYYRYARYTTRYHHYYRRPSGSGGDDGSGGGIDQGVIVSGQGGLRSVSRVSEPTQPTSATVGDVIANGKSHEQTVSEASLKEHADHDDLI